MSSLPASAPALDTLAFLVDGSPVTQSPAPDLAASLEIFELGESLGYDTAWLRDHPAPLTVLAAASQRTTRLHLGAWVSASARVDAELRLPELTTVDALAHGRLRVMLGPAAGGTSSSLGERGVLRRVLLPLDGATPAAAERFRDIADRRALDRRAVDVPVLVGTSEQVLDLLAGDPLVDAATELLLALPPDLPADDVAQVLHDVAVHIAPELGWRAHRDDVASGSVHEVPSNSRADRAA